MARDRTTGPGGRQAADAHEACNREEGAHNPQQGMAKCSELAGGEARGGARSRPRRPLVGTPARHRPRRSLLRAALFFLGLAGCVSPGRDVNLAPLYSEHYRAGGEREVEALAGIVRVRRPAPGAPVREWAIRPLLGHARTEDGSLTRYLVPLGTHRGRGNETITQLLPVFRYEHQGHELEPGEWMFYSLPGIFWARQRSGRVVRAVFPFGGIIENFFTYDRLTFVLFPLYAVSRRGEQTSRNFLFPIFNWTVGGRTKKARFWPLYGRSQREGSWDRLFVLWPIFHLHRNELGSPPGEREIKWAVLPLYGYSRRGSLTAHSLLWPFFGWARNPETGYWAWDGPWPLVRFHGGGQNPPSEIRRRFWPFWSHYRGDGLDSRWWVWPIFNLRRHELGDHVEEGSYLIPLWQRWQRTGLDGEPQDGFLKVWPLLQRSDVEGLQRTATPTLLPTWHTPVIDDYYAWIWEVYTSERRGTRHSQRSWGGIWRRERDEVEDRSSLSALWARRRYGEPDERITETSLLFGLIRWRKGPSGGVDWMTPSFPGPGWPPQPYRPVGSHPESPPEPEEGSR